MPPVLKRGMIFSGTDTTNRKLDVSDVIDQLSPDETPCLDLFGRDSLHSPCTQLLHEWLEDELRPRSGILLGNYTAGSGTMLLGSGQGSYLITDDIIALTNPANGLLLTFRVLAGPPDSDQITVSLLSGTDANLPGQTTTWEKIAHSSAEGANARTEASKTVLGKPFNYTQIIRDVALVTGTMSVIDRYGYASERAYAEEKVIRQLMIDFEKLLLYGVRSEVIVGKTRKSSMGGLYFYIVQQGLTAGDFGTPDLNIMDANNAALTETMLNDMLQRIWERGGMPDTILVNGYNKRRISGWATPRIRTTRDERTAGNYVTSYESDFGTLDIFKNRWLRPGDVAIVTRSEIGIGPLVGRQLSSRMLPSTGDYDWSEVLGEYTMEVHKPRHAHGWIYRTATSG